MKYRSLLLVGLLASSTAMAAQIPGVSSRGSSAPSSSEGSAAHTESDGEVKVYGGFDYVNGSFSNSASGTTFKSDLDMLRFRGGYRFFDVIAAEVQYGTSLGSGSNKADVDSYFAFFLVPTATVFDTFELAFPVGVSKLEVKQGGKTYTDGDISYGVQAELPLKQFADLPDLRLGGGFMVYHAGNATRTYGFNLGLRYDFDLSQFELVNPVTAIKDLFGGGDSAPAGSGAE